MFSKRFRFIKIILPGLLLLMLCLHSYQKVPLLYEEQLKADNHRDTKGTVSIKISNAKVIKVLGEGRLLLDYKTEKIEAKINPIPIIIGQSVSVEGHFLKDGTFAAKAVTIHKYRWLKKFVSALTSALVMLIIVAHYRFSIKERIIVERGSCRT